MIRGEKKEQQEKEEVTEVIHLQVEESRKLGLQKCVVPRVTSIKKRAYFSEKSTIAVTCMYRCFSLQMAIIVVLDNHKFRNE